MIAGCPTGSKQLWPVLSYCYATAGYLRSKWGVEPEVLASTICSDHCHTNWAHPAAGNAAEAAYRHAPSGLPQHGAVLHTVWCRLRRHWPSGEPHCFCLCAHVLDKAWVFRCCIHRVLAADCETYGICWHHWEAQLSKSCHYKEQTPSYQYQFTIDAFMMSLMTEHWWAWHPPAGHRTCWRKFAKRQSAGTVNYVKPAQVQALLTCSPALNVQAVGYGIPDQENLQP